MEVAPHAVVVSPVTRRYCPLCGVTDSVTCPVLLVVPFFTQDHVAAPGAWYRRDTVAFARGDHAETSATSSSRWR